MTPREIILAQLCHIETRPVPYTLPFEDDVAEQLDRHYGGAQWRQKLQEFIVGHYGISTVAEERINETHGRDIFGSIWRSDLRPWHLETPVLRKSSLQGYTFPRLDQFLAPAEAGKAQAIRRIREDREHFHIIGMGWGIFEHTWRMRGFENAMMDAVAEPDFYTELVGRLTELFVGLVKSCADVPADAIMFGDDWGDQRGVILGPDRWRRFIKPAWSQVYKEVHKQNKRVISHCCGSPAQIMPDILEMGMDVLESCQPEAAGMNPYDLKARWGDRITFWGCLGSQSTIPFGTPAEIKSEIRKLCREMGRGGGYIMAPAKPLQAGTPPENAAAIVEAFADQTTD